MDISAQLAEVFKSTICEELQNLTIPFLIFRGMDSIIFRLNMFGEHPIGKTGNCYDDRFLSLGFERISGGLSKNNCFGSVPIHVT